MKHEGDMRGGYMTIASFISLPVPALGVVWVFVEGSIPLVYCIVEEVMVEVEVGDGLVKPAVYIIHHTWALPHKSGPNPLCTLITILTPEEHSPPDHALLTAPTRVPSLKPVTKKVHIVSFGK